MSIVYQIYTHPHLGDNVILTGAARNIRAVYPEIIFQKINRYPDVFKYNSDWIDDDMIIKPIETKITYGTLYEEQHATNGNCVEGFTKMLCKALDLKQVPCITTQPILELTDKEKEEAEKWRGKWLLNANCQECTRSKGYPHWQRVIDGLKELEFIQIGGNEDRDISPDLTGVEDLRGKTSIRQLFIMAYGCDGVISPPSAISNIAGAFGKKQVIVNASREPDELLKYPNAVHISHKDTDCGWGIDNGCVSLRFDGNRRCEHCIDDGKGCWCRCQWETQPETIIKAVKELITGTNKTKKTRKKRGA